MKYVYVVYRETKLTLDKAHHMTDFICAYGNEHIAKVQALILQVKDADCNISYHVSEVVLED